MYAKTLTRSIMKQTKFPYSVKRPLTGSLEQSLTTNIAALPTLPTIISVTDLNNQIKTLFITNYKNQEHNVFGEISNYKTFNNAIYFTLKDNTSSVSCCIWNKNNFNFKNGNQVEVTGKLTLYTKTGQYQLTVSNVKQIGTGNLYENFEKLKEHYKTLGYFDKPKKQLHPYIDNICVITSQNGAALQDFLSVLEKSNYTGNVTIYNAVVQGNECPKSVTRALKLVNQLDFDVVCITRGGGSYEDLNGFNHPDVIEELNLINTITISAIGHEIDTVLTDFVADIRAATPTMAAEMITRNLIQPGYYYALLEFYKREIKRHIEKHMHFLQSSKINVPNDDLLIERYASQLLRIKDNCNIFMKRKLSDYENKLTKLQNNFDLIDIKNVLKNFVFIVDTNGTRVTNKKTYTKNIKNKQKMKIIFADGNVII